MTRDNMTPLGSHRAMKSLSESQREYIQRTRDARNKKSQHDVADAIGVDRVTYTGYETRRTMPQKYIAKFCDFTGVNERWLLTGEGQKMRDEKSSDEKMLDNIKALNDLHQAKVWGFIEALKSEEKK
jgi:transcriptional regulator with XRE-family HTH domain